MLDSLFPTLLSKTLIIVMIQLCIATLGAVSVVKFFRKKYEEGVDWITSSETKDGKVDLEVDPKKYKTLFYISLITSFILTMAFLFIMRKYNFNIDYTMKELIFPFALFSIVALIDGLTIGIVLISINENLGVKAFKLTLLATAICLVVAVKSGLDFSFLGPILFFGLIFLIGASMFRIFSSMSRGKERAISIMGVIIFVGYLLYDFNKIAKAEKLLGDNWGTALNMAMTIYLDIINLFMYILDLLSD